MEKPILYMSQALNEHEVRYGISDREGCAATWAIRSMRGYLRGAQVILVTDHSSLLALVKGGPMRSMRQQPYAMDFVRTLPYNSSQGRAKHAPGRCTQQMWVR